MVLHYDEFFSGSVHSISAYYYFCTYVVTGSKVFVYLSISSSFSQLMVHGTLMIFAMRGDGVSMCGCA